MSKQIPLSTVLPTVEQFATELDPVGPKWYDLGVFLGITTPELDGIGKYHGSEGAQRCLIELFKCFQSRSTPVSWNDIIDALTKIHNKYLADFIHDRYVRTTTSSLPTPNAEIDGENTGSGSQVMETVGVSETHDNEHIHIDKSISSEFHEISVSFTSLILNVKQALQRKSVSIDNLQEVLQDQCELEPLSTEEASFQRVFARMRQHYCFLNYHILKCLVRMFLSNEKPLQQLLSDYTNKLEKFKESVKIKDLMKLIKEKRDLCGNHKVVQLKTRDFWGNVTLRKFERLAKLIFQNLYDCAAQIRIEDGCICVSWVIPDVDTSAFVIESPNLLKVVGVISLKIDDKVLYEGPNDGCHILESAFLQALGLGIISAAELLIAIGCDTNIRMHNGEVAVIFAMKLIDFEGINILHLACFNGHTDVVLMLLEAGSSPEATTNNLVTPLMIASHNDRNEVVELLLKGKIDPDASLKDGTTAIYIASQNGHFDVVSTLLKYFADPNLANKNGWTPLIVASENGDNEIVELLSKGQANLNACLKDGATAICIACHNGHSAVVSTLLKYGADPNVAKEDGWTPLMIASHEGHSVVVSTLLQSGADPNLADNSGWTPLMIASHNDHNEVVEVLLNAKVDPDVCLKDGTTALYFASANGHSVIVSTLLTFGADPNIGRHINGWNPLIISSAKGHTDVVKQLIELRDININYKAVEGITAIHLASQYGHIDIVRILLESGADSRLVDTEGNQEPLLSNKVKMML